MRNRIVLTGCLVVGLVAAMPPAPAVSRPLPPASLQQDGGTSGDTGTGPEITVQTPAIEWQDARDGMVPYSWSARVDNPDRLLRSGMTGNVVIAAEGGGPGLIRSLWQEIAGVGL